MQKIKYTYDILKEKRKIIGRTSHVKILGKQGKSIVELAKIDTGAYSVSIDTETAKNLGFTQLIEILNEKEMCLDKPIEEVRGKNLYKDLYVKFKPIYNDLADVSVVFSGNGYTFRPCVEVNIEILGLKYKTLVNITDRKMMNYKIIVGRKLLKRFLIDVSLNDEKNISNKK